jgi:endonuclease YncB( thermonuclease family)
MERGGVRWEGDARGSYNIFMPRPKPTPLWRKLAAGMAAASTITAGSVGVYKSLPYFIGDQVERVIDGDTFILTNHQSVKLFGVDAPEPQNCYGKKATAYLTKLLKGKRVFLREPVTDIYRRIVALVYLDKKLVNELVVKNGFGLYTRNAQSATEVMQAANQYARNHALGIFSPICYQFTPPNPKCTIKGNLDRSQNKWVYLTPNCSYYKVTAIELFQGERWFCTEKEAITAGFTKDRYCP